MKTIAAGEFKTKCLSLLDEMNNSHETIIVTKQGVPIAQFSPIIKECDYAPSLHGSVLHEKDVVSPIKGIW